MSKIDIMNNILRDLSSENPWNAGQYLTDDFTFSGPVPSPIGKTEFLELLTGLRRAFPDWQFNHKDLQEKGNKVTGTVQISGTHKESLILPGLPTVAATGKSIKLPSEKLECTFEGDKLAEFKGEMAPGGGVPGIYSQLGVKLPLPSLQTAR